MNFISKFLKKAESSIFLGKIIHDFGVIDERKESGATYKESILLCEKNGKKKLVLKQTATAILGASVNYHYISSENLLAFKSAIDEAVRLTGQG